MSKEQLIDQLWEQSNHGTERKDIVAAFEAGEAAAKQSVIKCLSSRAYKDGAMLSVEICNLDDEAVGDFGERIEEEVESWISS